MIYSIHLTDIFLNVLFLYVPSVTHLPVTAISQSYLISLYGSATEIAKVSYQKVTLSTYEIATRLPLPSRDLRFHSGISAVNYRNCTLSRIWFHGKLEVRDDDSGRGERVRLSCWYLTPLERERETVDLYLHRRCIHTIATYTINVRERS